MESQQHRNPGKKDPMIVTAKSPKLSQTMGQYLTNVAATQAKYGSDRVVFNGRNTTAKALVSRGLLELTDHPKPTYGASHILVITAAGWSWLAEHGVDRPADAGRLTVEEALADVAWRDGMTGYSYSELDAILDARTLYPGAAEDADRLTVEEALAEAYPAAGERTYTRDDQVIVRQSHFDTWNRTWVPQPAFTARYVSYWRNGLHAVREDDHQTIVYVRLEDMEPAAEKPAITELAAEDFKPGYRYWAVRPGFEAAWTIASVELKTAEYSVWRDGREVTPELVVITRADGNVRTLEKGEMVAVMGPWKS
jgi:hypothetical protein